MTEIPRTIDVLIVEDNPADADLIEEYLIGGSRNRYAFTTRDSLAGALSAMANLRPDVILLDLGLPDGQGIGNVGALRGANEEVPIIVLTGQDDEELALDCIDAGAEDYLWKSEIRASSLRRAIRHSIARYAEKRQRIRLEQRLRLALSNALGEFIPVCANCKNVRCDEEEWVTMETYLAANLSAQPSHTICPKCTKKLYPEMRT